MLYRLLASFTFSFHNGVYADTTAALLYQCHHRPPQCHTAGSSRFDESLSMHGAVSGAVDEGRHRGGVATSNEAANQNFVSLQLHFQLRSVLRVLLLDHFLNWVPWVQAGTLPTIVRNP